MGIINRPRYKVFRVSHFSYQIRKRHLWFWYRPISLYYFKAQFGEITWHELKADPIFLTSKSFITATKACEKYNKAPGEQLIGYLYFNPGLPNEGAKPAKIRAKHLRNLCRMAKNGTIKWVC
jgi:hypothetical protein